MKKPKKRKLKIRRLKILLGKILRNEGEASSEYWIHYRGGLWRDVCRKYYLPKIISVDHNDEDEITYMTNVTLLNKDCTIWKVYSNGTCRKIKIGIPRRLPYKILKRKIEKEKRRYDKGF